MLNKQNEKKIIDQEQSRANQLLSLFCPKISWKFTYSLHLPILLSTFFIIFRRMYVALNVSNVRYVRLMSSQIRLSSVCSLDVGAPYTEG